MGDFRSRASAIWPLALTFAVESVYMGMELLASRLLSPGFGTTLAVWTSILSVVLLSGAIGNLYGARWVEANGDDTGACKRRLALLLGLCGACFAVMPAIADLFVDGAPSFDMMMGPIMASASMFFLPALAFGHMATLLVSCYAKGADVETGVASGHMSAAMTCGGVFGTCLFGFFLVPALGSRNLSFLCCAFLCALGAGVFLETFKGGHEGRAKFGTRPVVAIVAICAIVCGGVVASVGLGQATAAPEGVDEWRDTEYGRVHIVDGTYGESPVRRLLIDGGFESAMFLDTPGATPLVFDYTSRIYDIVCETLDEDYADHRVAVMGGGAYSLPCAFAEDGFDVTCVEIDPGVTQVARDYFMLSEFEGEGPGHVRSINSDARVWLADSEGADYDVIINDTFAGNVPARTLAVREAAELAQRSLDDGGIYIVNAIGWDVSHKESLLADEVATLEDVFAHVWVVRDSNWATGGYNNYIIVASDSDTWQLPEEMEAEIAKVRGENVRVLTDEWCPVEWLVENDRSLLPQSK